MVRLVSPKEAAGKLEWPLVLFPLVVPVVPLSPTLFKEAPESRLDDQVPCGSQYTTDGRRTCSGEATGRLKSGFAN